MTTKNEDANHSKISEMKIRQIVKLFSLDLDVSQIVKMTGLNRNTINRYFSEIRTRISEYCVTQSLFSGKVELDAAKILLFIIVPVFADQKGITLVDT